MSNGIPQLHLTNNVKLKGHDDVAFVGSSFLIAYNNQFYACAHGALLTSAFGINPGINNKKGIPSIVTEWLLSPRIHVKGLLKKKLVIENPIRVIKYLNLDSPSQILLMDVTFPDGGNYTGIQLSDATIEEDMAIMVTTCPIDRKDISQGFFFGEVVNDDLDGNFAIILNDDMPHRSISGSPVADTNGRLIGIIVGFLYFEEQLVFIAERTTQLKKDLYANFGEPIEIEQPEAPPIEGPYISLSIDIEGEGFGSPKELDLRAQVENEVEKRNLGKVIDAGTGFGKMDITFACANDMDGIKDVLKEFKLLHKTDITQQD
jgi:hypothetical protein